MSFFPRIGERLPASQLDFATLVAALGAGAKAPAQSEAAQAAPCPGDLGIASDLCLAAVILGRPGWQQAARALGGGFGLGCGS